MKKVQGVEVRKADINYLWGEGGIALIEVFLLTLDNRIDFYPGSDMLYIPQFNHYSQIKGLSQLPNETINIFIFGFNLNNSNFHSSTFSLVSQMLRFEKAYMSLVYLHDNNHPKKQN